MANVQFMVVNNEGRIIQNNSCPDAFLHLQSLGGDHIVEGNLPTALFYIHITNQIVDADGDEIRPQEYTAIMRHQSPAKITGLRLFDLPVPCVVTINGKDYECDEDHADLEFNLPGVYKITVTAFPFIDANFEVTVP